MSKYTIGIECKVLEEEGNFKLVEIEASGHIDPAYIILNGKTPVSVQSQLMYAMADWEVWAEGV